MFSSTACEYYWILLWILTLLSALNIYANIAHPEIVRQSRLKWETEIYWRCHEILFEKVTGPQNIQLYGPLGYKKLFQKFVKPSRPLSYILNVHSLMMKSQKKSFRNILVFLLRSWSQTMVHEGLILRKILKY